mgnify:CR=1 FL=1
MKSEKEGIYPQNMTENLLNSNKKYNSRNSINNENYFANNNFLANNYISKSFNSIDKNQKGNKLNEIPNPQIKNQFNNKKFTNNIINYCLINPNNNSNIQRQSNNFFYNIEKDLLFNEDEKPFPKPEPTPIKIDKSTKYINISKNFDINNKSTDIEKNNGDIRLITFLHNLNLDYLGSIFKNNYINFKDLFLLTKDDFIEMKIPIGPRNKIIYFIELYKKSMKNFEIEDILYFFKNINDQKKDKIISTMPSTNNNASIIRDNDNLLFLNQSETKREYILNKKMHNIKSNNNDFNNILDSSFRGNVSNINLKTSINKSILEINNLNLNSRDILDSNHNKNNVSLLENRKIKKKTKKNFYKSCDSYISQNKYNNKNQKDKNKKTNNNKYIFNIQAFNKKYNKENIYYRNSNNLFQNISTKKSNNYNNNMNLKTSKISKYSNNSYFNNSSKRINNPKKIKRSNSIKISEKFNKINFLESFKNLSSEIERFENKYKKMKKDSCERKKKIKTLLMGNKSSTGKIKYLKQQMDNIKKNNLQHYEDVDYVDKNI